MTKRMVNAAVLAAVLTVAVLGPSTTFAAGHGKQVVSSEVRSTGIIAMLLEMVGFNPVSGPAKGKPTAPTSPGTVSPTPSTEEAIWGGSGRCTRC